MTLLGIPLVEFNLLLEEIHEVNNSATMDGKEGGGNKTTKNQNQQLTAEEKHQNEMISSQLKHWKILA